VKRAFLVFAALLFAVTAVKAAPVKVTLVRWPYT
jgi:hypothetical protein